MTVAQKLKVAEQELKEWRSRRSFLAKKDKRELEGKLRVLTKRVKDLELDNIKLDGYRVAYNKQIARNRTLSQENKTLKAKIAYMHQWYKEKIKEVWSDKD